MKKLDKPVLFGSLEYRNTINIFLYKTLARVLAQRETLEAREISLRRALQLASSYENSKCGIQSEETLRSLLNIKDDKIAALEKCIKELEGQIRR